MNPLETRVLNGIAYLTAMRERGEANTERYVKLAQVLETLFEEYHSPFAIRTPNWVGVYRDKWLGISLNKRYFVQTWNDKIGMWETQSVFHELCKAQAAGGGRIEDVWTGKLIGG